MDITTLQALVTRTAAANGSSVAVTSFTGDWTLVVEVTALTDGAKARLTFEDSVDAFTNKLAGPTVSLSGSLAAGSQPRRYTFQKYDFPSLRMGVASSVLRLALTELTGTSPSITYRAWIE